jgi:hypothetical protein
MDGGDDIDVQDAVGVVDPIEDVDEVDVEDLAGKELNDKHGVIEDMFARLRFLL